MNLIIMMSKSIVTYSLFRATRTIAKSTIDALDGVNTNIKAGNCNHCGLVAEYQEKCPRCESRMFKMFKGYDSQVNQNLVDDNLSLVS